MVGCRRKFFISQHLKHLNKPSNIFHFKTKSIVLFKKDSVTLKVGRSPSKNICVISLIESTLKMIQNAFYFILKALENLKLGISLNQ